MGYGSPAWASLIAQIRRDPTSTELRDIAADYLIEHDDPRGEYIVLRDKLARGVDPSEYVAVYERHRELERERPWAAQLEALGLLWRAPFSGFVEHALLDRSTFPRLPELCRHEPITELSCSHVDQLTAELVELVELADIRTLYLDDASASLLASPHLGAVRDFQTWRPSPEFVDALCSSVLRPHKIGLGQQFVADGLSLLAKLATSPVLDELRELPVTTDEGIAALGEHALPRLERLDTTPLSRATIERLVKNFDQLCALRIGANAGVVLPVVVANMRSGLLRELTLVICEADVVSVIELIDSAACLGLRSITIRGVPCPLSIEQALRKLAFHGHLREVTVEARRGARIRIDGVQVIEAA